MSKRRIDTSTNEDKGTKRSRVSDNFESYQDTISREIESLQERGLFNSPTPNTLNIVVIIDSKTGYVRCKTR